MLRHGRVVEQGSHASLLKTHGYYSRLWSQQTKKKYPKTMIEDASQLQQQPDKGKSKPQNTGDLIDMDDSQSISGIGPILKVPKLRRTRPHRSAMFLDTEDPKESVLGERYEGNSLGVDQFQSKSTLKPDAPEFVPSSRVNHTNYQLPSKHDNIDESQDCSENPVETENITEAAGALLEGEDLEHPAKNDSRSGQKRRIESRRVSSILQQTHNGVVLAYPKKARKRRKGTKRQPILRRERTESEPIGMGLTTEYYQQ